MISAHKGWEVCRTVNDGRWNSLEICGTFCGILLAQIPGRTHYRCYSARFSENTIKVLSLCSRCMCVDHISYTGLYISLCNDPVFSCSSKVTHRTNTFLSLRERPPFPVFHFHFLAKTVALLPQRARTLVATRARCRSKGTNGVWQAMLTFKPIL